MRAIVLCALFASLASAEGITIVLDFDGPHSEQAVAEMKREFEGIVKDAPITVDWRTRQEAQHEALANLVVVRFKGKCILDPVPYLYDERGPMAFTYSTSGVVQPFSEVACEQVTTAVRSAMFGGDFAKADLLLGRALGRVLAHEVVHMLSGSGDHGREGVARKSLTGNQLIAPELKLAPEDLDRLHARR
ncbi:MAG TPA: hypothetical protein VE959_19050 [Bryobacteraceae bacterium]|nr:hypothetical protein [Bryobacteraceae bacterium]